MSINIMPATSVDARASDNVQSLPDPAQLDIYPVLQDSRDAPRWLVRASGRVQR